MQDSKDEYPTTLPGYPPEYFDKLVPPARVDPDKFHQLEAPMYNYQDLSPLGFEQSQKGKTFNPIDPASMYVSCHSWVSYPYGIPDPDQACPYCVEPVEEEEESRTNTVTSLTTESDAPVPTPPQQSNASPKPSPVFSIPEPNQRSMPVHITETLMWTG